MISDPLRGKPNQKTCPSCGANFTCGLLAEKTSCWCDKLPHISPVAGEEHGFRCPACLRELISTVELSQSNRAYSLLNNPTQRPQPKLIEGEDFYREGSAIVFTARYHLRRGYCCGSGCRHCPYRL